MKIAIPFENDEIFQHFGHCEQFKIYDVADGAITGSKVVRPEVGGHGALAGYLTGMGVEAVICGGLGGGMTMALETGGIKVYPGIVGNADEAVERLLVGELEEGGANCDHHGHGGHGGHGEAGGCGGGCGGGEDEDAGCGGGCGGGGGGCGSCGGGCGGSYEPPFDGPNVGKIVRTHYRGTLDDGTEFDNSYDRGEPLEFVCGAGMMILGFDEAVADMKPGETKEVHLPPEKAYGEVNPFAIMAVPIERLPGAEELAIGERVMLSNPAGQQFPVTVIERDETTITFDANHEMAGKNLNFVIELVEVEDVEK